MTPEIIIGLGLLLMIVGYAIYKKSSSKFKWKQNTASGNYNLVYKEWTSVILTRDSGKIDAFQHRGNTELFRITNCPSIKWAKDKAEQVILEDEKKLAK